MSWVKLDDNFSDHPKVISLSDRAFRALVRSMCYCARHETNGRVPKVKAHEFAGRRAFAELLESGRWEAAEGGVSVHDYLVYNPSRETLEAKRAATADRVTKWRSNGVGNGVTNAVSNTAPVPVPLPLPQSLRTDIASITDSAKQAGSLADAPMPKTPHDMQVYLVEWLQERDPERWGSLTMGGIVKLNSKHGRSAVLVALQHAQEETKAGTLSVRSAYAFLDAVAGTVLA